MNTITITKENFWQKMSLIYKKVNTNWKLRIKLEKEDNWNNFSTKNKKAYMQSRKDLEAWNALSLDELKSKYM